MHMIERTAAVACSKCLTVNKGGLHWYYMGKLESGKNSGAQPKNSPLHCAGTSCEKMLFAWLVALQEVPLYIQ